MYEYESLSKPRLTRFEDLVILVGELKRMGIAGSSLYERVAEIGPVDLDVLADVLAIETKPGAPSLIAA